MLTFDISNARRPWVVVVTNFPSPYQVDIFNQVHVSDELLLTVVYEQSVSTHRMWRDISLSHSHIFLTECSRSESRKIVERADLIVFSGYRNARVRSLMTLREACGRPWVFWGERMGLQFPLWLGAYYRKFALASLHTSDAGMWGIGRLAVNQFATEFGKKRNYTNVPYSSNLSGFLAIRRGKEARKRLRFLFSGGFLRRKGFDLLLKAYEQLVEQDMDVELFVVGNGPLEVDASRLVDKYPDRVRYFGFVQPPALPDIYAECDILCAPSRHDGWALVVVEGMAAAMPVISTSATGAAFDLVDSGCGWLIPPDNQAALYSAMKAAAGLSLNERLAIGMVGRKRALDFDQGAGAARFINAAMSAIDRSSLTRGVSA